MKSKDEKNGRSKEGTQVKAIHSSEPAARDEGPRLLPLRHDDEEVSMNHYLQLADAALATARAKEKKVVSKEAPGEEKDSQAS